MLYCSNDEIYLLIRLADLFLQAAMGDCTHRKDKNYESLNAIHESLCEVMCLYQSNNSYT